MAPNSVIRGSTVSQEETEAYAPLASPQKVSVEPSVVARAILFMSVGLSLLHPMQYGWSVSQVNLSTFHNDDDCNARPVAPGTCLMFPGHSSASWKWVVNLWIVGGIIGSLGCARISDKFGRKKALMLNALVMIVGAVIQASASSVGVYAFGRFVSGLASGAGSVLVNGYINEISPPHLRNLLGALYQSLLGIGVILVASSFFFADTSSGWRYIGGFPIILGAVFLLGAPIWMVESPAWLLTQGRRDEARQVLTRLYGPESVELALSWLESSQEVEEGEESEVTEAPVNPWKALVSPEVRQQTLVAIMLSISQQMSGINIVFFYSSSMFKDAGLDDDRIGTIIVIIMSVLPTFFSGRLGSRIGNRRVIIGGHIGMMLAATGIIISLSVSSPVISIVFTALYVACFALSLGPLVFVILTSIFPDWLRSSGTSLCLFINWLGALVIGIGYPYVSDALDDLGFLPFVILLAGFGLFMHKFLPETAGKTTDEIQSLFRREPETTK
ncbi:hypothetical protein Poli38472_007863 [Pythium oligandrum]|uniref:Hexose transporter 1 n=1 Tax=Pythium oligandrum TaxID=41045 RepID=A0A8K1FMF5_PYTOL|nr:hypothetical protein Poli38472_007863 [Pythium oligandrum]|eukprot:TMW68191.1 hypothetical protein Poli38472_007863 [Pythium oligandrum]